MYLLLNTVNVYSLKYPNVELDVITCAMIYMHN